MTKVTKMSQYKMVVLSIQKIFFCYIKLVELKRENINTDDAVTGWMLCVIPQIREDFL